MDPTTTLSRLAHPASSAAAATASTATVALVLNIALDMPVSPLTCR
jgi:hypothetical protein